MDIHQILLESLFTRRASEMFFIKLMKSFVLLARPHPEFNIVHFESF